MNAIWGFVNLNNSSASVQLGLKMKERFNYCKIDRVKYIQYKNIFMGCGIQYVTNESIKEILPIIDPELGLVITADIIIDNRDELIDKLSINDKDITDGQLALLSYKRWGKDCGNHIIGDYSIVIWDDRIQELIFIKDHVGKQSLYYYFKDGIIAFSTLMKPLFPIIGDDIKLNERWLVDFLALDGMLNESTVGETVYKDIYETKSASVYTFSKYKVNIYKYWDPGKNSRQLIFDSDEEYEKEFLKVFEEAIKCRLRSCGKIGIQLSGGLDSSSIACVAAKLLDKDNLNLRAYNNIPFSKYKNNLSKYIIADEREYIDSIINKYKNIDVLSTSCEEYDSVSNIDELVGILEQPYKIVENLYWCNELMRIAENDGCKIMLTGQYGNCTISFGDFETITRTYLLKGEFKNIVNEIRGYSRLYNIPMKEVIKFFIKINIPYFIRNIYRKAKYTDYDMFKFSLINNDIASKWNVKNRFNKYKYNQLTSKAYNLEDARRLIVDDRSFSHLSMIETSMSLVRGIISRDPTRDKRVIEFCMAIHPNQYLRNGKGRYLIRNYMKGILPDKIRCNYDFRGRQSVDWTQRLVRRNEDIIDSLNDLFVNKDILNYINIDKLKKDANKINSNKNYVMNSNEGRRVVISLIFNYFINNYNI